IFLANVQSLANKMDELLLRTSSHKRIKKCNVMIFTETWLNNNIPSSAIELGGRSVFQADRTAEDSGKCRGGGLCIYVNNSWCTDSAVTESHCSVHLEYLMIRCRPFYLPREFSAIVVTAVYIPPDANAKLAMEELHAASSKQQSAHPEGAIVVAGDFTHSNLKSVLPKFHRNVSCSTRGDKTLDQVYTNIPGAYTAIPLPYLGQSDHLSLFMLPKYTRVKPAVKTVKVWPEGAISSLQQQFQDTDWNMFASQATLDSHTDMDTYTSSDIVDDADWDMFRRSSDDVMFTEAVVGFIGKLVENTVQKTTIRKFPNQKPWVDK
ncbi:hypothetical protein C0J45_23589, partial [Silurus meridionalis]